MQVFFDPRDGRAQGGRFFFIGTGLEIVGVRLEGVAEGRAAAQPGQFCIHEPNFQFSFTYKQEDVQIYLDMVASGKMKFPGMVTDVVSLDHAVDMGLGRKDRKGQLKILVDPSL